MNEIDYYLDVFKKSRRQIRLIPLLILSILGLSFVTWENYYTKDLQEYKKNFPKLFSEFSRENNDILTKLSNEKRQFYADSVRRYMLDTLTKWLEVHKQSYSKNTRQLILDSLQSCPIMIDDSVNITPIEIPYLDEYIKMTAPSVGHSQKLFGWELSYSIYLIVATCMPTILLFWGLFQANRMKRVSLILSKHSLTPVARLTLQSILTDRIVEAKNRFRGLRLV